MTTACREYVSVKHGSIMLYDSLGKFADRPLASGLRVTSWRRSNQCRGRPAVRGRSVHWPGTTSSRHWTRRGRSSSSSHQSRPDDDSDAVRAPRSPRTAIHSLCAAQTSVALAGGNSGGMTARIFVQSIRNIRARRRRRRERETETKQTTRSPVRDVTSVTFKILHIALQLASESKAVFNYSLV